MDRLTQDIRFLENPVADGKLARWGRALKASGGMILAHSPLGAWRRTRLADSKTGILHSSSALASNVIYNCPAPKCLHAS